MCSAPMKNPMLEKFAKVAAVELGTAAVSFAAQAAEQCGSEPMRDYLAQIRFRVGSSSNEEF